MNSEKDYLAECAKVIPILAAIILAFSAVRMGAYYFFFKINIFTYCEIMEIIPQSINSFMFNCGVGIALFFLVKFLASLILSESGIREMYSQPTFLQSVNVYPFAFYLVLLFSGTLVMSSILALFGLVGGYLILKIVVYILLTLGLTGILIEISRTYYNKHQKFISKRFLYLIIFTAYCIVIGVVDGAVSTFTIKNNNTYLKNSITLNKAVINSTPTFYYVGKTAKYVFFYNEETESSEAYSISTIEKLTLSE